MSATERQRRWRANNPDAARAAKRKELDRRKMRTEAVRKFAQALATTTKETK